MFLLLLFPNLPLSLVQEAGRRKYWHLIWTFMNPEELFPENRPQLLGSIWQDIGGSKMQRFSHFFLSFKMPIEGCKMIKSESKTQLRIIQFLPFFPAWIRSYRRISWKNRIFIGCAVANSNLAPFAIVMDIFRPIPCFPYCHVQYFQRTLYIDKKEKKIFLIY